MTLLRIAWDTKRDAQSEKIAKLAYSSLLKLDIEWKSAFEEDAPQLMLLIADKTWPVSEKVSFTNCCLGGLMIVGEPIAERLKRNVPPPLPAINDSIIVIYSDFFIDTDFTEKILSETKTKIDLLIRSAMVSFALGHQNISFAAKKIALASTLEYLIVHSSNLADKNRKAENADKTCESCSNYQAKIDLPWPPGESLKKTTKPWNKIANQLIEQGLEVKLLRHSFGERVPEICRCLPLGLDEIAKIEHDRDIPEIQYSSNDTLGLFVSKTPDILPPGIHLFCDSIRQTANDHQLPVEMLAWHVFWHELGHAILFEYGGPAFISPEISPFNLEEIWCEAYAVKSLKNGLNKHTGTSGPKFAKTWQIEAMNTKNNLWPYLGYRSIQSLAAVIDDETILKLTLAFRHYAGMAFRPIESDDHYKARVFVADTVEFLTRASGTPWSWRYAKIWADGWNNTREKMFSTATSWPIYFWGAQS